MMNSNKEEASSEKEKSIKLTVQANAAHETIDRFGTAAKEHLVAYSGIDNECGKILKRSLKDISNSKINPDYARQNIKQQAGFSAENKYTARKNAENIISGSDERYIRTDDLERVNDPLYDHVRLDRSGIEIPGSGEQMKFVGKTPKDCLDKLTSRQFQKYLDADAQITVPSDLYKGINSEIDKQLAKLEQEIRLAKANQNLELINTLNSKIQKFKKIKSNIKNSGISNQEAIFARLHPGLSTAKDIAQISHRAGVEQMKTGAAICGGISLIKNVVAVSKGEKEASQAAVDFVKETGTGAVTSYTMAFAGSIVKGGMQNAQSSAIRNLSKSNMPAMIVQSSIEIATSFNKYCKGQISGSECLTEIGEKGTCNISAYIFALAGQAVIPIPVVGGLVGSIVGYTLTSKYIQEIKNSFKEAKYMHEERIRIERDCKEAIAMMKKYREEMNALCYQYLNHYREIFNNAFHQMEQAFMTNDINQFIMGANSITLALGKEVQYRNMDEFENFMNSDEDFIL